MSPSQVRPLDPPRTATVTVTAPPPRSPRPEITWHDFVIPVLTFLSVTLGAVAAADPTVIPQAVKVYIGALGLGFGAVLGLFRPTMLRKE
jgi:hypothetical protein